MLKAFLPVRRQHSQLMLTSHTVPPMVLTALGNRKGLAVHFLVDNEHAGHVGLVVEELSEHLHLVQGEGLDLRRLGLDGLDAAVQGRSPSA